MTYHTKSNGSVRYFFSLALLAIYSLFCWIIYQNSSFEVNRTFPTSIRGPHSGNYYSQAAERLQYVAHAPGEIDRLYTLSMIHCPADWKVFMSYFQYLRSRDCCQEKAARAIEEVLRRTPSTTKPYVVAIAFFLDTGRKEEAFQYFQKAVEKDPKSLRDLFSIVADRNLSVKEVIRIVPRDTEGLSVLAAYLAKKGPSEKEEWYRTVQELRSTTEEPSEILRIAEQAFGLGDIDLARRYAEMAWKYPETQNKAKKLLARIDRKLSK